MAKQTAAADSTNTQETPEQQVTVNPDPAQATQSNGQTQNEPEAPPEKTFTQADLDRIVKERLDREKGKYADYATLKQAADKLKEIEDAQKTETEKLQERLQQLENQATQTAAENKRLKLTAKIASIAGTMGAVDPNDPNFQQATQAIDPDGDGADEQIKKSIEALKAQRPYLFGKAQPHLETFNPEGGGGGVGETDDQKRARLFGGRNDDLWDPAPAAKRGGGVHFTPGWDNKT